MKQTQKFRFDLKECEITLILKAIGKLDLITISEEERRIIKKVWPKFQNKPAWIPSIEVKLKGTHIDETING